MVHGENLTFDELSNNVRMKILNDGHGSGQIDVVFDLYKEQSIKAAEWVNLGSKDGIVVNQIKLGHRIKNWKRLLATTESNNKIKRFLVDGWKEKGE